MALATPPPAPEPFALDDEPCRPRRRAPSRGAAQAEGANPLLVIGGYLCAVVSLALFPPAFGLAGLVFGTVCLTQRSTGHGMLIVVLSLVCASVGMIWGVEVAIFGHPRFLMH